MRKPTNGIEMIPNAGSIQVNFWVRRLPLMKDEDVEVVCPSESDSEGCGGKKLAFSLGTSEMK